MEKVPDWATLWRELVEAQARGRKATGQAEEQDFWRGRARDFDSTVRRRWARPDSLRDFVTSRLGADRTVLDIGAGTGAWTALMARRSRRVTAVEPSSAMIEVMRERLDAEGICNVDIVQGSWPAAAGEVEPHDCCFCAHAAYGNADFPSFVRRMEGHARVDCYLLLRAPLLDGVMAEAATLVWGQPHWQADMIVAFNALARMGILASVVLEEPRRSESWSHPTLEDALLEVKRRLDIVQSREHDAPLADLLRRRLEFRDGRYEWPGSTRSALLYWGAS